MKNGCLGLGSVRIEEARGVDEAENRSGFRVRGRGEVIGGE